MNMNKFIKSPPALHPAHPATAFIDKTTKLDLVAIEEALLSGIRVLRAQLQPLREDVNQSTHSDYRRCQLEAMKNKLARDIIANISQSSVDKRAYPEVESIVFVLPKDEALEIIEAIRMLKKHYHGQLVLHNPM